MLSNTTVGIPTRLRSCRLFAYEGQKSGQSQRIDYAGGIGRTNTWPPQDVPPDAKVVQNFQDKSRAKYMEQLPETCQLSAYTALNLSVHPTTHYESVMYIKGLSLPGLLPLVPLIDFGG